MVLLAFPVHAGALAQGQQMIDCIRLSEVTGTDVIDDQSIVFHMRGGRDVVMRLQFECPTLKFDDSFYYSVVGGRLCKTDIITTRSGFACPILEFQNSETPAAGQP